jgi:hypothetical protein
MSYNTKVTIYLDFIKAMFALFVITMAWVLPMRLVLGY